MLPGLSVPQFSLSDSLSSPETSRSIASPWSYSFDVPYNVPFSISMRLDAQAVSTTASTGASMANFYDTAKIDLIQIPVGRVAAA